METTLNVGDKAPLDELCVKQELAGYLHIDNIYAIRGFILIGRILKYIEYFNINYYNYIIRRLSDFTCNKSKSLHKYFCI